MPPPASSTAFWNFLVTPTHAIIAFTSSVPGFAEHAHPVASQDFRDVDGRVAVARQFREEVREVGYSATLR